MENVSSSNGLELYPKLRFPEFTDPWKSCHLGDIYDERIERGGNEVLLSVTINNGVILRSEIEGKDNSSDDKKNYKTVEIGDMVYNTMRMWQGANGISSYSGIVSPAYTVLKARQKIDNNFFEALFKNNLLINRFRCYSQGLTSDTWNLKYPQIKSIKVSIPEYSEQQKIATMINIFNNRIEMQLQYVNDLKKYKRGLSERIFTNKKSIHRESIDSSQWEVLSFDNVFEYLQNNTFSRDMLNNSDGKIQNIHYGDVLIKYGDFINVDNVSVPYINTTVILDKYTNNSYLKTGDIVFADTAEDYSVGKVVEIINPSSKQILSGLHTIPCRPKICFAPMYLGYYLNSNAFRKQLLPLIQGTKVSSISKNGILSTKIEYPSLEEQKHIAAVLSRIDIKIYSEEHLLVSLKNIRLSLLQKLFI